MRERILDSRPAEVDLLKGSGGVFEIAVDGDLVFSKKALGRFPTDAEVDSIIDK